jgi:hypothetical protein
MARGLLYCRWTQIRMLKEPKMKTKHLIIGAFVLATAAPASATLITFDFNSIPLTGNAPHTSGTTLDGLSKAADSFLIQSNMNAVLAAASIPSTATVTGALATLNYTADGFGIGPTLGTSDGATSYTDASHPSLASPDKFIMNDDFPIFGSASSSITIQFTNLALGTVSFDWEIFADSTCSTPPCSTHPSNSNFPNLDFWVDGIHQGSTPTFLASVIPGQAAQGIGTASFALNLPAGTHTLRFVDWPPEIGIDNLTIQTCRSTDRGCLGLAVPEPSPLSLAGLALALLALVRWGTRRPATR